MPGLTFCIICIMLATVLNSLSIYFLRQRIEWEKQQKKNKDQLYDTSSHEFLESSSHEFLESSSHEFLE